MAGSGPAPSRARAGQAATLCALAVLLVAPAWAAGSTASIADRQLQILGEGSEANVITVTGTRVEDRAGVRAGEGCVQLTPTVADCPDFYRVNADLGDGDDTFTMTESTSVEVQAGDGADAVRAGAGQDDLFGGAGDDTLEGGDGPDSLRGGAGRDTLLAGGGYDQIEATDTEVDQIDCGTEEDFGDADPEDVLTACEGVERVATPFDFRIFAPKRMAMHVFVGVAYEGSFVVSHPYGNLRADLVVTRAEARRTGLGRRSVSLAGYRGRLDHAGTFTFDLVLRKRFRDRVKEIRGKLRATAVFVLTIQGRVERREVPVVFYYVSQPHDPRAPASARHQQALAF